MPNPPYPSHHGLSHNILGDDPVTDYAAKTDLTATNANVSTNAANLAADIANLVTANALIVANKASADGSFTAASAALATTNANLATASLSIVPVGGTILWPSASIPTGWLLCNGQAISRATFAALFTLLGTGWGTGDGSTTFNIPDMRGRVPIGSGTGTGLTARALAGILGEELHQLLDTEMSSHTHTIPAHSHTQTAHSHSDSGHIHGYYGGVTIFGAQAGGATLYVNGLTNTGVGAAVLSSIAPAISAGSAAVTGSFGNDTAHNNMQPSVGINFIIKT